MTPILVSYLETTLARHKLAVAGYADSDEAACLLEQLEFLRGQMDGHERAGVLLVDRLLARYEP